MLAVIITSVINQHVRKGLIEYNTIDAATTIVVHYCVVSGASLQVDSYFTIIGAVVVSKCVPFRSGPINTQQIVGASIVRYLGIINTD